MIVAATAVGSFPEALILVLVVIVGALIGGFLLSFFLDTAGGGWWFTLFTAIPAVRSSTSWPASRHSWP